MVYKGLGCIGAGRMPHIDYVYEANRKCVLLALKLYRGGIKGAGVYQNGSCVSY